jgi:hypothetical protein
LTIFIMAFIAFGFLINSKMRTGTICPNIPNEFVFGFARGTTVASSA